MYVDYRQNRREIFLNVVYGSSIFGRKIAITWKNLFEFVSFFFLNTKFGIVKKERKNLYLFI